METIETTRVLTETQEDNVRETTAFLRSALIAYGKEFSFPVSEINLLIYGADKEGTPAYRVLKNFSTSLKEITLEQVIKKVNALASLGSMVGFINKKVKENEKKISLFLQESIKKYAFELKCATNEVRFIVLTVDDKTVDPLIALYKNNEYQKKLTITDLI